MNFENTKKSWEFTQKSFSNFSWMTKGGLQEWSPWLLFDEKVNHAGNALEAFNGYETMKDYVNGHYTWTVIGKVGFQVINFVALLTEVAVGIGASVVGIFGTLGGLVATGVCAVYDGITSGISRGQKVPLESIDVSRAADLANANIEEQADIAGPLDDETRGIQSARKMLGK